MAERASPPIEGGGLTPHLRWVDRPIQHIGVPVARIHRQRRCPVAPPHCVDHGVVHLCAAPVDRAAPMDVRMRACMGEAGSCLLSPPPDTEGRQSPSGGRWAAWGDPCPPGTQRRPPGALTRVRARGHVHAPRHPQCRAANTAFSDITSPSDNGVRDRLRGVTAVTCIYACPQPAFTSSSHDDESGSTYGNPSSTAFNGISSCM